MKITEPKTPFVRYNAETDEEEGGMQEVVANKIWVLLHFVDIPALDLGNSYSSPPSKHPSPVHSPIVSEFQTDLSRSSSRRPSFSNSGQPSFPSRSASGSSGRSASFSSSLQEAIGKEPRASTSKAYREEIESDDDGTDEIGVFQDALVANLANTCNVQLLSSMQHSYELEDGITLMRPEQ